MSDLEQTIRWLLDGAEACERMVASVVEANEWCLADRYRQLCCGDPALLGQAAAMRAKAVELSARLN